MSGFVKTRTDHDVAVIAIDNPPVNALTVELVEQISSELEEMNLDSSVKAAVVIGAGRTFAAGADIREFGRMTSGGPRINLLPLLLRIENSRKPVVMAIHGAAFGGGLELAMAGHYRVASPSAQLGQLEVRLGLIPGAGGTQRLPRLVGVAKAVEMCAGGNPISSAEALAVGLIDRVIDGEDEKDLLTGALGFAREVANRSVPRTRERIAKLDTVEDNATIFASARAATGLKQRGIRAPLAAIDAVEASTKIPFEEGCEVEARLFDECLFSDQSRALIHVFFGEREVSRIPDIPKDTPVIPVNKVAVVGAGTMGGAIAMVFANAGIPVLLKDVDHSVLNDGMARIKKNYENSVRRGRFSQATADERMERISPVASYDAFSSVDMVIEAVFEGMELKKKVFADLDRSCRPGAILASNTSTLSIDEIAASTSRPEAVVGTHFFSPANVMRLLEIVRGKQSSKEVVATCMQLSKIVGKIGVLVGNCRGFVGNRMFGPYRREAQFLIEEGADIEAVDQALVEFGCAMGPLATGDLAGLDVGWRIRKEHRHLEKPGIRQPIAEDRLCELGRYGQKTSAGWYRYDNSRRAISDPEVKILMQKWSAEVGISRRQISRGEIVDRCVYALINEGARILEEGYALRAVDIDIIYINGYGFPAYLGGPMWHADTIGLGRVYDRICEFHRAHGELWAPAPLLKGLARDGKTFAQFDRERILSPGI